MERQRDQRRGPDLLEPHHRPAERRGPGRRRSGSGVCGRQEVRRLALLGRRRRARENADRQGHRRRDGRRVPRSSGAVDPDARRPQRPAAGGEGPGRGPHRRGPRTGQRTTRRLCTWPSTSGGSSFRAAGRARRRRAFRWPISRCCWPRPTSTPCSSRSGTA